MFQSSGDHRLLISDPSRGTESTYHHADAVLLSSWSHLQRVVHHQVHEGIEPAQDALNVSAAVQLHYRTHEGLISG